MPSFEPNTAGHRQRPHSLLFLSTERVQEGSWAGGEREGNDGGGHPRPAAGEERRADPQWGTVWRSCWSGVSHASVLCDSIGSISCPNPWWGITLCFPSLEFTGKHIQRVPPWFTQLKHFTEGLHETNKRYLLDLLFLFWQTFSWRPCTSWLVCFIDVT